MADAQPKRKGHIPPATMVEIVDVVSVAPDAIVSRELARTSGGTVTAFAFDAGQGLSEHTAPFDALVQVLEGRLEITIGSEAVSLAGGQLVLMPADIPHALHASLPTTMLLTMLRDQGKGEQHAGS